MVQQSVNKYIVLTDILCYMVDLNICAFFLFCWEHYSLELHKLRKRVTAPLTTLRVLDATRQVMLRCATWWQPRTNHLTPALQAHTQRSYTYSLAQREGIAIKTHLHCNPAPFTSACLPVLYGCVKRFSYFSKVCANRYVTWSAITPWSLEFWGIFALWTTCREVVISVHFEQPSGRSLAFQETLTKFRSTGIQHRGITWNCSWQEFCVRPNRRYCIFTVKLTLNDRYNIA